MSEQDSQPLVDIFMTSAVRTSAGPGPGHKQLPAAEANRLIGQRFAVAGTEPPRSFEGTPEASDRAFDGNFNPHGSRAGLRD